MKNQITPRDYELLSAYLDNQLSSKERLAFEKRLQEIPELQNELQEVNQTRLLLRNMPKLRAPHNYLISPKTAQVTRKIPTTNRMAPVMGIVSAIATILLVLVIFSGEVTTPATSIVQAPMVEAPAESMAVEQEVQRSVEIQPSPTPPAPPAMMEAMPVISPEPTSEPVLELGVVLPTPEQTLEATPTTIYLEVPSVTNTPEGELFKFSELAGATSIPCFEYLKNPAKYPSPEYTNDCLTPTGTPTAELLHSFAITETIITSATDIATPTLTPTATPTASPSPTPTSTSSPTPTTTPEPSATQTPADIQDSTLKGLVPTEAALSSGASTTLDQGMVATPTLDEASVQSQEVTVNAGLSYYLILAAEISLALIAIITGTLAIFMRFRAGR